MGYRKASLMSGMVFRDRFKDSSAVIHELTAQLALNRVAQQRIALLHRDDVRRQLRNVVQRRIEG
jgi:hypothetical protein